MYVLNHIHVGPTFAGESLHISDSPMFSGSGGGNSGPPKPPKAPLKKPGKKKK